MTKANNPQSTATALKERFREGAIPLQSDFATLIDMAQQGAEAATLIPADKALGQGLRKGSGGLLEIDAEPHDFSAPVAGERLPLQIDASDNTPCIRYHHGLAAGSQGLTIKAGAGLKVDGDGISVDPHFASPKGIIVMWSGEDNAIPAGWYLCNGKNGTPDLTERFILGRGEMYPTIGGSFWHKTDPVRVTGTVTVEPHALTTEEMPPHSHGYSGLNAAEETQLYGWGTATKINQYESVLKNTKSSGSGKKHAHNAKLEIKEHTHVLECIPPYYALAFIMKG